MSGVFGNKPGGRSSVVERRSVEADVTGSSPVGHPRKMVRTLAVGNIFLV